MSPVAKRNKRTITPATAWTLLAIMAGAMLIFTIFRPLDLLRTTGVEDPAVGLPLPLLQLDPLTGDGKPMDLQATKGRVTLLNFWGTWCPPCRREFPHIVELYNQHEDNKDFLLLAVSCPGQGTEDMDELREATQQFLGHHETTMPTYADPESATQFAVNAVVGLQGIPTTIVLDRSGTIRGVWRGYSPADVPRIKKLVAQLLAET